MAEIGMACFGVVAAKVTEWVLAPIERQIRFAFNYENFEDLKEQVEKLRHRRERVQHSVDEAHRQGNEVEKDVEKWLTRVNELIERVERSIIEDEEKAKKRCFKGLCLNPVMRYFLNKKAVAAAKDCVNGWRDGEFDRVFYRPVLQKSESMYCRGYEEFETRTLLLQEIMRSLNDANINMIGVYGMGGVGKTTLAKKVVWQAEQDKLFDEVILVEVKQKPDLKKIQGQIAFQLGMELQEEIDSARAARLRERLKKEKRVLVILDDIWVKLDLEAIGIPFECDRKGSVTQQVDKEGRNDNERACKILLTSRNLNVLRNDMNTQKDFLVDILTEEEAENLFWKFVGASVEKFDVKPIADKIVSKCAGLPVAIKTIASALKHKKLPEWKNAESQLRISKPKKINGMEANVYAPIKLSYDYLESGEAKSLFLLCSLYNSGDGGISINDLLKYGMGLGLFEEVYTLEDGRNTLYKLINDLRDSCLLMDMNDNFVSMHDVIHAVANSLASTNELMYNIQNAAGLKKRLEEDLPKDLKALCLPCRNFDELPERLEFPKLRLLYLFSNGSLLQIPDAFFEGAKELKVLDITRVHLLSVTPSLCRLTNLQTLCLDQCLLGDIALIGELKKLEILSFWGSDITELPGEIRQLTRLKLLDLSNCRKLKVIQPNVISSLTKLEELYMGNGFVGWEVEGNASLAELKQLLHLTVLEVHVHDAQNISKDLSFEKLDRFRILIGDVWNWFDRCEISRALKLKLNNHIYLSQGVKALLKKTEDLYLDELKGVKNVLYELNSDGFRHLKHLRVRNTSEVLFIVNSWNSSPCINSFPMLESLILHNLISLEKVCHGKLTTGSFTKLKTMEVEKCNKLKHLFSVCLLRRLSNLQQIEVTDCKNLTEIVSKEIEGHEQENEGSSKIELTHLRSLKLQCLPQLSCFGFNVKMPLISQSSSTTDMGFQEIFVEDDLHNFLPIFSHSVVLPNLEKLELSSINIECRWLDQFPVISSCRKLTRLIVEECSGLKFLFSYSMVESMAQLQELEIRNCKSMEGIINTEELGQGDTMKMTFHKLHSLQLKGLPNLVRFGSGSSVEFSSLIAVEIEGCPNLKTFFSGSMVADIVVSNKQEEINLDNCGAGIHSFFDEKVVSPALTSLNMCFISSHTIWHKQAMSSCFKNLTRLVTIGCHNLKYLFSSSMVESLVQLQVLHICNCKSMEEVIVSEEESITRMFPLLRSLMLKDLPKLTRFCCYVRNFIELSSLAWLWIASCPDMETLVICNSTSVDMPANMESLEDMKSESDENLHTDTPLFDEKVRLPALKFLHIEEMDNLRTIWHNKQLRFDSSKLESIAVIKCNKLSHVFPSNMLGRLPKLGALWILKCDLLQEIFKFQAVNCGERQNVTTTPLRLVLCYLPKLKHVINYQDYLSFQNLISIEIRSCHMIEEIVAKDEESDADHSQFVFPQLRSLIFVDLSSLRRFYPGLSFQNLISIEIRSCDSLKSLFPAKIAKGLVQLEVLCISTCNMIEEIVAKDEESDADPSQFVFPQLKSLVFLDLSSLRRFYPGLYFSKWPMLKELKIIQCSEVKVLTSEFSSLQEVHGESQDENSIQQSLFSVDKVAFPNLENLSLGWNCIAKEIRNGKFSEYSCKLKFFEVVFARKENDICPSCLLFTLPVLETLHLICGIFEEIFICEGSGCKEKHDAAPSKLRHLMLFNLLGPLNLPEQSSLLCNGFQELAALVVSGCGYFKNLMVFSVSFQNLTSLEVSKCRRLLNLMADSSVKSLAQLTRMSIVDCQMIEEIIVHTGDKMEERIIFKQLKYLGLQCLPRLRSFYSGNCTIEFPSLQQVVLRQCPNMEIFSQGVVNTPNLPKVQMIEEKDGGCWEGNLNNTVQKLFQDMSAESSEQN